MGRLNELNPNKYSDQELQNIERHIDRIIDERNLTLFIPDDSLSDEQKKMKDLYVDVLERMLRLAQGFDEEILFVPMNGLVINRSRKRNKTAITYCWGIFKKIDKINNGGSI